MKSKTNGTNEPIYKTEIESQIQKTNLWLWEVGAGEGEEGINQETGVDTYTLLYIKQITHKDLPQDLPDPGIEPRSPALQADILTSEPPGKPYSTGNSPQYSVMTYTGKESKKEGIYVYA